MRKLALIPLLLGAAACDVGSGMQPDVAVINVRVVDDRGVPINRTELNVQLPSVERIDGKTGSDGVASIGVADAGTYRVTVIPRAGFYSGPDGSSRIVEVAPNTRTSVEFKLYREGIVPETPLVPPIQQ